MCVHVFFVEVSAARRTRELRRKVQAAARNFSVTSVATYHKYISYDLAVWPGLSPDADAVHDNMRFTARPSTRGFSFTHDIVSSCTVFDIAAII